MRTSSSATTSKNSPLTVTVGNFYPFTSLETDHRSSRCSSFIERAAFTDAFNYNSPPRRRPQPRNKAGDVHAHGGLFSSASIDSELRHDRLEVGARHVYAPLMGGNQLHFGVNFQHREFQSNNGATQQFAMRRRPTSWPLSRAAADPDHRPALRRHRHLRRQGRRHRRARSWAACSSRSTSPPKRRNCGSRRL